MILNKENIKDQFCSKIKLIDFEDFSVRIKVLGIKQQLELEEINAGKKTHGELILAMLKHCCVDEKGSPIFDDATVGDLAPDVALKIWDKCLELNGFKTNMEERIKKS